MGIIESVDMAEKVVKEQLDDFLFKLTTKDDAPEAFAHPLETAITEYIQSVESMKKWVKAAFLFIEAVSIGDLK